MCANTFLNQLKFDLLIIDEARQAKFSMLTPLQIDTRVIVLVGGEKQLPATMVSQSCAGFGFSKFLRCTDNTVESYLLSVQYRDCRPTPF